MEGIKFRCDLLFLSLLSEAVAAFECLLDNDCRSSGLLDINSYYCVDNRCTKLKRGGMYCARPEECASYPYYGPLACSATCKPNNECYSPEVEKTPFCCRTIPKKGACSPGRPGMLSGCSALHVCETKEGEGACSDAQGQSWMLGVFCSVFGNILINVGINYQKKSYTQDYFNILGVTVNVMLIGSIIYCCGKLVSFMAYLFGSQSMIAGLSATGLISNSIFAPLINQEIFTWKDAAAIVFVVLGTTILVSNTSVSHAVYSLCELLKMYKSPGTLAWFGFIISSIVLLFLFLKFVEINSDWELYDSEYFQFLSTDVFFDEDGIVCKYLMIFVYVLLSSFIASFTTLSIKSLAEIIDRIYKGDNLLFSKMFNFFIFSLVACTLLQIYWLNRALKHYDALLVIPIFHITWTILSILTAGIYFQDFDHYSPGQVRGFIWGLLTIFIGSIFLATRITARNRVETDEVSIPESPSKKEE